MADFQHIIRILNTNIKGDKAIKISLQNIKGVGANLARIVCNVAGVDHTKKAGALSDAEITSIETVLKNPLKHGIPEWMLNRRNDYETGENKHLLLGDLTFTIQNDIKREQKSKSYIGLRHAARLPVRGQRTKANFRKNKGKAVGGKKKTSIRK